MNESPPDIVQLRQEIFELHNLGKWQEALTLIDTNLPDYDKPADLAKLTFWRACFLSRMGHTDRAVAALQDGIKRGLWWSEARLRHDDDLQPLQDMAAYNQLIAESVKRHQQAEANDSGTTTRLIRIPSDTEPPYPAILALHGYGSNAAIALSHWGALSTHGWFVGAIQSSQLAGMDEYHWVDHDKTINDVKSNVEELKQEHTLDFGRLTMGGYSNGGTAVLTLALLKTIPVKQVISVGGTLRDHTIDAIQRSDLDLSSAPRILLIVGENDDYVLPRLTDQADVLRKHGLDVTLQAISEMGHNVPSDLTDRVRSWLQ